MSSAGDGEGANGNEASTGKKKALPGGAEKLRAKRQKLLKDEAQKCMKLTELFGAAKKLQVQPIPTPVPADELSVPLPTPPPAPYILDTHPKTPPSSPNRNEETYTPLPPPLPEEAAGQDPNFHYFQRPSDGERAHFFREHPFQPIQWTKSV